MQNINTNKNFFYNKYIADIFVFISTIISLLATTLTMYLLCKLCKTASSIHLFKITDTLKAENIKLNKNYLWDTLEIDWKEVTVAFNGNKIDLPRVVIITLQNKFKVRLLKIREPLLFHLMLK